jgi:hypothetical protein
MDSDLLRETDAGKKARVQQDVYALEMQNRQHRTHAFTLYIAGKSARIFRWDRAGCIVSTPINLISDPQHLLNCIYRLATGGRTAQGFDPTAQLVSKADIEKLRAYNPTNRYLQAYREYILHPDSLRHYPIHKVCISMSALEPVTLSSQRCLCRSHASAFHGQMIKR